MLGSAGMGYQGGFLASIADPFGAAVVMFLMGFFFVRTFRRMKLLTFIEYFEDRFGKFAGVVASIGLIMSNVGWTGALLVAFGYVFQTLTNVPMEWGILGGARGGFRDLGETLGAAHGSASYGVRGAGRSSRGRGGPSSGGYR